MSDDDEIEELDITAGIKNVRRLSEPDDRLGRLAAAMLDAFEAHPECGDDVKVIILLDTATDGTIVQHGYGSIEDDDSAAFVALIHHIAALAKANGMRMEMIGIPNSPEGL
jgi:hypothetical protein